MISALAQAGRDAYFIPDPLNFFKLRSWFLVCDAEKLVQDVFIRLMQRARMGGIDHAERYIFCAASSVLIDRSRRATARRAGDHLELKEEHHPAHTDTPDRLIEAMQQAAIVEATLLKLPDRVRMAFTLHRLEELSYGQIAAEMAVSVSPVE